MSEDLDHPFIDFDGAYVLGALSSEDRAAFETHLAECGECRARVAELAPLPDLLALVPASAYAAPPVTADPVVVMLATARASRRRRRWITAVAAGAAAACLVAATAVIARNESTTPQPATRVVAAATMSAVTVAPIHASIEVTDVAWGTSIRLHCTYDEGVDYPPDEQYALIVETRSGQSDTLGTWGLVPGKVTTFPAGTAIHKADIKSITVDTANGTPLLQLSY